MKVESVKGTWIYWKWIKDGSKTFSKSYVQDIVKTDQGLLLELRDNEIYTVYPNRVLSKDVIILEISK